MACVVMARVGGCTVPRRGSSSSPTPSHSSVRARACGHACGHACRYARRHAYKRAADLCYAPLESSRRGGHFEYRHVCTRAAVLPSAMADVEPMCTWPGPMKRDRLSTRFLVAADAIAFLRACSCASVRARACVLPCARAFVRVCVRACVRARARVRPCVPSTSVCPRLI